MNWPENRVTVSVSNIIAILLLILGTILPVFFFFWTLCNRKKWRNEEFQDRYGSYLDGMAFTRSRKKVGIIITTTAFFLRRLLLCATLVFWQDCFWGQVAIQM